MSWVKPAVLNGYLSNIMYRINYTPNNGNVSAHLFIQHSSSGSPQNFTLQGLSPDMVYSVRVYAGRRRNDGVERWSGHVSKTVKTWQIGKRNLAYALLRLSYTRSNGACIVDDVWGESFDPKFKGSLSTSVHCGRPVDVISFAVQKTRFARIFGRVFYAFSHPPKENYLDVKCGISA